MILRALTALVLMPAVLYLVLWAPQWLFMAALLAVVLRSVYEYFEVSRAAGLGAFRWLGYAGCAALCLAQWADVRWFSGSASGGATAVILVSLTIPVALAILLVWTRELHDYAGAASTTLFGIFYVGLSLSWLVPLRFPGAAIVQAVAPAMPPGQILLFLFLVIWAGDIFAYFVGRGFGRVLLFPRISPKKTLEGSLGGLAGSLVVAWLLARWWKAPDLKTTLVLAGVVAIAGQAGDLVESALKRSANLKDSASLLPGHGGMLDRVDSLILSAPVLWAALAVKSLLAPLMIH
jgi:phosphatidate cytidylyltransferase